MRPSDHFPFGSALLIVTALAALAPSAGAATIWYGPVITYNQPSPDPTQAINQDRLTPHVWLTRGPTQGMFNAVTESAYDKPIDSDPTDTEWSYGDLTNYASLNYTPWAQMSGNNPPSMVNKQAVVHLISDDIYISIKFLFWGGSSGGYTYARSTPGNPAPSVTITNPANGSVFAAPANVRLAADASVTGGTVTNVQFFTNGSPAGSVTNAPFSVTASNLIAGSYALTAVATAGGVASTSSVVNITVVTPIPVVLSAPLVTNSTFSFRYSANPGLTYLVQKSADLIQWSSLSTNVAATNPMAVTNTVVSPGAAFYRVARLPNP